MARPVDLAIRGHAKTIKLIALFGILGLVILTLPVAENEIVLTYSVLDALLVAVFTSNSLRTRLSSARAHTVPGYRRVHITGVVGLSTINLILATGVAVHGGLPLMPVALGLWSISVLAWIAGYFLPGLTWNFPRFLPFIIITVAVLGAAFSVIAGLALVRLEKLFEAIDRSLSWEIAVLLFLINSAVTILMLRRILHLNEEAFEYFRTNPREMVQTLYKNRKEPGLTGLDSIQTTLPSRIGPQLRHLEMGLFPATRPPFIRLAVALTAIFLATRFFYKGPAMPFLLGGAIGIPVGSFFFTRQYLRRFFLLPLRRSELVAKGGSAMLLAGLRMWCACALADVISSWVIPYKLLLISLVIQLPLFGLLALALSVRAPLTNGKQLLLIPSLLALSVLIAGISTLSVQAQFAICVASGSGLIWLAYRRWCNVELD